MHQGESFRESPAERSVSFPGLSPSRALSLLTGAGIILALHLHGRLIRAEWMLHLIWAVPALLATAWLVKSGRECTMDSRDFPLVTLLLCMVLFLFSSAVLHRHFFLISWVPPDGGAALSLKWGISRFAILTALCAPILVVFRKRVSLILLLVLLFTQALCLFELIRQTGGAALYRDDHPAFMLRLWTFARSVPRLVCYSPFWNGGKVTPYIIASGIVPLGLLFWPLWRFAPILTVYTPIVGVTFIVLVPWLVAGSLRMIGADRKSMLCGGLLSLGSCWYFLHYLLHFGTIGSLFCNALIVPVCAALYRVLWLDKREFRLAVVLIAASASFLAWPGSVFIAPLIGVGILLSIRRFTRKKLLFLVACGLVIVLLVLPVFLGVEFHGDIGKFAERGDSVRWHGGSLRAGWLRLCAHLRQANPVLVFLGIAGLFFLRQRGLALMLGPVMIGTMAISGWGGEWKPIFQFERMAMVFCLSACIPAALACGRIMGNGNRWLLPARAALVVLLGMGGYSASRYYKDYTREKHATMSPVLREMVSWVRCNTKDDSRILFAGRTVHGYGGGHVSFLPILTGRDMMACDYYAFSMRLVEYEYPPREWRSEGNQGIFDFMELHNVGHVITYHDHWKRHLRSDPGKYEEVATFKQRTLEAAAFRVKREYSFLAKGRGRVTSTVNRIEVQLDEPADDVVLRYNWAEGLTAQGDVDVYPFDAGKGVRLIGVRPKGAMSFAVRYGGLF